MENSPEKRLKSQIDGNIAILTLNRPEKANALNTTLAQELTEALRHASANADLRAIILTGTGTRAFCAGIDFTDRAAATPETWAAHHHTFETLLEVLLACPIPIIAAVNGAALGGGCELALACDLIVASESARFGLPETSLGFIPGMGGTQTLPRVVGSRRAAEMLFTAQPITAAQGKEWGMVGRVTAPDHLMDEALALAQHIAANAPLAVKAAKQLLRDTHNQPLTEGLKRELAAYQTLIPTHDRAEGVAAHLAKRKPEFKGN